MYNIIIENENHITTLLTTLTLNIEMVNIIEKNVLPSNWLFNNIKVEDFISYR